MKNKVKFLCVLQKATLLIYANIKCVDPNGNRTTERLDTFVNYVVRTIQLYQQGIVFDTLIKTEKSVLFTSAPILVCMISNCFQEPL